LLTHTLFSSHASPDIFSLSLHDALPISREMVFRHPFPGPGLGVRILGEVNREYADLLRQADAIFTEELRSSDWYEQTAQAFAVLDRKSTRLNSSHEWISYAVFCLKKKKN